MLILMINTDLSFNNIEVIDGLDCLPKLEDLTLYNNRISTLENMDQLTRLHVFSIGNNNLGSLENVCIITVVSLWNIMQDFKSFYALVCSSEVNLLQILTNSFVQYVWICFLGYSQLHIIVVCLHLCLFSFQF